jgi:lantibiotic modifying enzyme
MPRSAPLEFVPPDSAQRAVAMAALIGERLLRENEDFMATRGFAGLSGTAYALLQLAKVTDDARYLEAAKRTLRRAAHGDDQPLLGLFTGISGLRAVAALLAREEGKPDGLVGQCDDYVEQRLPTAAAKVKSFDDYDVLAGWSGIRLSRCVAGARPADDVVALLRWLIADDDRWCCPHPLRLSEPSENDLGLAHGIAGVLSTLALTVDEPDAELRALLARQATALRRRAIDANGVIAWPPYAQAPHGTIARAAWCYGAVGIATSLYWVGRRLGDEELGRFALEALEEHASAPCDRWGLSDFALCHGTLGNALAYASVATESGSERLARAATAGVDFALDGLERDGGACLGRGPDGNRYDYAGELDGAAGIVLALLTLSGKTGSQWLRLHVLEPLTSE